MYMNMGHEAVIEARERGKTYVRGILQGLISRLTEKREEFVSEGLPSPRNYFHQLNLHPRIADVSKIFLLMDTIGRRFLRQPRLSSIT
jgi:hypothetical protein